MCALFLAPPRTYLRLDLHLLDHRDLACKFPGFLDLTYVVIDLLNQLAGRRLEGCGRDQLQEVCMLIDDLTVPILDPSQIRLNVWDIAECLVVIWDHLLLLFLDALGEGF